MANKKNPPCHPNIMKSINKKYVDTMFSLLVVHLRVVVSYGNRSLIQLYRRSESVGACFGGVGAVISHRLKYRRWSVSLP